MPTLSVTDLRDFTIDTLMALGTPRDKAEVVCENLVGANLVGHDSHGVLRLTTYADWVRSGLIVPTCDPKIATEFAATARIDGEWCWGAVGGKFATEKAIELARQFGVAAVTLDHCAHIGRLGSYTEWMAEAGMAGIATTNHMASVAAFGGKTRVLGTNPWAMATPREEGSAPIVVDFATSGVAEGKLRVARYKGESVAPGLIVDIDGNPSTTPADFYAGGALLPFGGHKGYGMSLMADILGGLLSGAGSGSDGTFAGANGTLFIAVDIARFVPLDFFRTQSEAVAERIHASAPAHGFNGVLLPGEPEAATRAIREQGGIYIPDTTWQDLQELRASLPTLPPAPLL
jgi:LDH2 family malate/lactate/ureidoglycolate dehydrogenase